MNYFSLMNGAVFSKLSGSTALTTALGGTAIYYQLAPDDKPLPYVVWNWQSVVDENLTPSRMTNAILNVRAYASTPTQAGSVDAIIDGLFSGTAFTVTGWTNFWTAREDFFSDASVLPNQEKVYGTGGFYRIRLGQ